jgi:hypothetical protein
MDGYFNVKASHTFDVISEDHASAEIKSPDDPVNTPTPARSNSKQIEAGASSDDNLTDAPSNDLVVRDHERRHAVLELIQHLDRRVSVPRSDVPRAHRLVVRAREENGRIAIVPHAVDALLTVGQKLESVFFHLHGTVTNMRVAFKLADHFACGYIPQKYCFVSPTRRELAIVVCPGTAQSTGVGQNAVHGDDRCSTPWQGTHTATSCTSYPWRP